MAANNGLSIADDNSLFACGFYSRAFLFESGLTNHMRSHTRSPPTDSRKLFSPDLSSPICNKVRQNRSGLVPYVKSDNINGQCNKLSKQDLLSLQ